MRMGQIISRVKSVERGGGGWKVEHGRAPTPLPLRLKWKSILLQPENSKRQNTKKI